MADSDRVALYAAHAQREIERLADCRTAKGTDFLFDGVLYRAEEEALAQQDFPRLQAEYGVNVLEKDPRMLTALPPDFVDVSKIRPMKHIVLPATGDPYADRYRVESVLPIRIANVRVGWKMLIFTDPEPAPDTEE